MPSHTYDLHVSWTPGPGRGTTDHRSYSRDVLARAEGRPDLELSADRPFRGDPTRWNPELLLLAALSECHLLSLLHVAVREGVEVIAYQDRPRAWLEQEGIGGRITRVLLRPRVRVADEEHLTLLPELHRRAGQACFIASSVAFPVEVEGTASR